MPDLSLATIDEILDEIGRRDFPSALVCIDRATNDQKSQPNITRLYGNKMTCLGSVSHLKDMLLHMFRSGAVTSDGPPPTGEQN